MTGEGAEAVSLSLPLNRNNKILVFIGALLFSEKSHPAVVLSPRQRQDSSQPANPRYLMTVSTARDLTLVYTLPERAAEAYSASIMSFRGNAKYINSILLRYFFPPFSLFVSIKP